ncbi:MAG: CpsD/CapB family tyrosine-protein kinase [Deltaproteobacteria bacterium]|uniref:CpsD/CapB family tyrosine-protein kinase n=1 Tax=Candidatus Desulfacyla euxinica TaxID=2841693 RepID=A0A8J6MZR3_9DELT|nr:CpsD/CapB family tyrosine-protein kinase [Candidatus Desulfacyla euxinica]MBL7217574.1 CpsD/CapB family tyrosine-protein kinase [Desulfobacteraceae bacterium]
MAKTFEALKRSEAENRVSPVKAFDRTVETENWAQPGPILSYDAERPYHNLRTNVRTRYTGESIKSILFAGSTHGEGASMVAVNFARILARESELKVLLVDLTEKTDQLAESESNKDSIPAPATDLSGHTNSKITERKTGPGNLYALEYNDNHSGFIGLIESGALDHVLKEAYDRFDYIILVAPPVLASLEARAICAKVDGVVLVLASGKTRWQIAQKAKETLETAGGEILGVVLNKAKHYIPQWIYRRL